MAIKIIKDKCKGCSLCIKACPFDALKIADRLAVVDEVNCTDCNACISKCIFGALKSDKREGERKRAAKFEMLIEDIDKAIRRKYKNKGFFYGGLIAYKEALACIPSPLSILFKEECLNEFGKKIIKTASFRLCESENNELTDPWEEKYRNFSFSQYGKDDKLIIEAAKFFSRWCREEQNRSEAYKFIFWALMILSVDNTDADAKLSLICDFARMLKITDDEIMDIVYTIKIIYHEIDKEYEFKTEIVPAILGNVFYLYDN